MGEFFKKLFDFGNIKKLFTYNWGEVFSNIAPQSGKTIVVNDEEFTNVQNGAILMASGSLLSGLVGIIAAAILASAASFLYGGGLLMGIIIGGIVSIVLLALIVPGFIFFYNRSARGKEKGTVGYFIIWILGLLSVLGLIYNLISELTSIGSSPISSLLSIALLFLNFMGIVHLLVGTIDICVRCNKGTAASAAPAQAQSEVPTYQGETPAAQEAPAAVEGPKFCPSCGAPLNGGKFCPKCGRQL